MIIGVDRTGDLPAARSAEGDAELIAGLLRRRRRVLRVVLAVAIVGWLVVGVVLGSATQVAFAVLWGALWAAAWWAPVDAELRGLTDEALQVRHGRRTRTVARTDVVGVRPWYRGAYGLEVTVRGADPVWLHETAPRFSVADAQAAALRRWAGLDDPVS